MTLVSIIIPVYNVEKYIRRCIDSVLVQTMKDFELILIDDGSPDKCGDICDEYAKCDSRINVVHKENEGVSAARNTGLDLAKKKYVVFLDSDDEIEKDYIETLLQVDEDIDLVVCGIEKRNKERKCIINTKVVSRTVEVITTQEIIKMEQEKTLNFIYAKRFKNEVLQNKKIRFNPELSLGEDTLFVTDYLYYCECIRFLEDELYIYYVYGSGTLSSVDDNYVEKLEEANRLIEDSLRKRWEITNNSEWKKRMWSVYHYTIFYILKSTEIKGWNKIKGLQKILKRKSIKGYLKNIDFYMSDESKIIRRIIATRNAYLIFLFWRLSEYKKRKGCVC